MEGNEAAVAKMQQNANSAKAEQEEGGGDPRNKSNRGRSGRRTDGLTGFSVPIEDRLEPIGEDTAERRESV